MPVYTEPVYYEIAFSFFNVEDQVTLLEEFISTYSRREVNRFLDIGCGPSLQLRELAKRGYQTVGLDEKPEMLAYLQEKAQEQHTTIETVEADMCNFCVDDIDCAFIMMGTIGLIESNEQFLMHLDAVASSLKKGGLYLMENFKLDWAKEDFFDSQNWVMEQDKIQVETTYSVQLKDSLAQMLTETLTLNVDDHGKKEVFSEKRDVKLIFPQEFLILVEMHKKFEFIGWFERDSVKRLTKANNDNIIVLRRT
jgi:SAM-dependent methyltransferase